ncbi:MAG TPA: RidA family protein [Vicinamibacterales bacterium]|nr:RidA family protein [Vicinamibacterales bacterium]
MNRWLITFNLVALAGIGLLATQQLERINPKGLSTPQTYTHVIKAGKLVFIAGQVGATADGKMAGTGMKEQTEQALENLRTALGSQRLDFSHVAKINIYTTSIADFRAADVVEVRNRFFGANRPASTLVQIQQLASPEYKVEIEAIAVAP